jgi:PAS domain S-box-containing protein
MHEILFEHAQDIILYIKLEGQIVNANKRACEQYGYTKEELLLMKIQDLRHPSTVSEYEYQMQMADEEGITFDCIHMRKDGSNFPVEVSAKSISTENGRFRIHIIRDITMRKKNQEKIIWLAKYDSLTEIPNRANFMLRLDEEILRSMRSKIPFAVIMFDVDKFKQYNDHYGHETGDFALKHVALTVQSV